MRPKKNFTTEEAIANAEKKIADCTAEIKVQKKALRALLKKKQQEDAAVQVLEEQENLKKINEYILKTGKSAEEILASISK